MKETLVWFVSGDDTDWGKPQLWLTKMDAEVYARELFPDEGEHDRYARIFYRRVFSREVQA